MLNRARFCSLRASQIRVGLWVSAFAGMDASLIVAADETLERFTVEVMPQFK